jgi:hypothetical protein
MPTRSTVTSIVAVAVMAISVDALSLRNDFGSSKTLSAAQLSPGSGVAKPIQPGTSGIGRGSKGGIHPSKGDGSIDETFSPHSTR